MHKVDALAAISPLKTGDLVLFAGSGSWLGRLWPRPTAWTHVGLVLRSADDAEPQLWEAQDGLHRGTRLVALAGRIARFPGRISARCLSRPLDARQSERLKALRRELSQAPQHGLWDLIAAAEDVRLGARPEHLGDPTDAELVATVYQGLGLLDDLESGGSVPGRFRPRHFAASYGLELRNGYALGPEIVLQEAAPEVGWSDFRPQPV
jgi:hypothetical protein